MMLGAALSLALAAPSDIQFVSPADSGPVSLVVVVMPSGGDFLQFLQFPQTAEHPQGEVGALIEYRRTFVGRVLAGPAVPARITMREVGPETWSMSRAPQRRLAFVERTTSGYWHMQWSRRIDRGRACVDQEALAHFQVVIPRHWPDRNGEICFSL